MDDHSWMYRDSPQGLIIVTGFRVLLISQHLSRKNFTDGGISVHAGSVKIKSFCIKML